MANIDVFYNNDQQLGGPVFLNADLASGNRLLTLAAVSIGTDGIAEAGWEPSEAFPDRMGWWGDAYTTRTIGCRGWQLRHSGLDDGTIAYATVIYSAAIQWMVDDELISSFDLSVSRVGSNGLAVNYTLYAPLSGQIIGSRTINTLWDEINIPAYNATAQTYSGTMTSSVPGDITTG